MADMLSQEEINALLNGGADMAADPSAGAEFDETLTTEEEDAIGEIGNISMGTAATTLFSLLNQKVTITTPNVSYATWETLMESYDRPCVFIQISYKVGLDGNNVLILKEQDVKVITDLMMGGDGTNTDGELGELHLSAICEAMNQMMGSSATSLSSMLGRMIDISPPTANLIDLNEEVEDGVIPEFLRGNFIKIAFRMEIGDLVDSEIMQLYPFDFARELYKIFASDISTEAPVASSPEELPQPAAAPAAAPTPAPAPEPQPQMDMGMQQPQMGMAPQMDMGMQPQMGMPMQGMPMGMPMQGMPMGMPMMQQNVNVQPAQFQAFSSNVPYGNPSENIDIIRDVPLQVTVELGRTSKSIQEILDFAPGTIIELDKIAGEPIDVLVNGKFVAKGEVVVIEESFGVKVTEIIR